MKNFVLILCFIVFGWSTAHAQSFTSPAPLQGFAWSPNVGWVSMTGSNYGVVVNPSGTVTGYSWSPHVGWIRFGGVSGCPSGSCAARVDLTTSVFSGWARALNSGSGWDGWISLNASNHGAGTYGLNVGTAGTFSPSSYAWGSDVVGWTSFSQVFVNTPCTTTNVCTADATGVDTTNVWCETSNTTCSVGESCALVNNRCEPGVDDLTISPLTVRRGETIDITWETRPGFYSDCRVDGLGGPWTGLQNATGVTSAPMNTARVDFTLTCTVTATGAEILLDTETAFVIAEIYES